MLISSFYKFPTRLAIFSLKCLVVTALTSAARAQATGEAPPPHISQTGGKSRIVFDYSEAPEATPTPTPAPRPSPTPSVPPEQVEPYPVFHPTPAPEPSPIAAVVPPAPAPTPSPEAPVLGPVIQPAPEPVMTPPAPQPLAAATPDAPLPAQAIPTPIAEAVNQTAPAPQPTPEPIPPVAPAPQAPAAIVQTPAPRSPAPVETATPEGPMPQPDVVADAASTNLAPTASDTAPRTPSDSVTINLINKLVERGILSKQEAAEMIKQAEAEAQAVREQMQADMFSVAQATAIQAADAQAVKSTNNAAPSADEMRITYIPEPVKTQIKEDIKMELASDARAGRIKMGPQANLPGWVANIHPFADLRVRYEGIFFPDGNDATGAFPNFNAINTGAPFDVTGNQFAPQYNVDQNRNRFRIRLRLGADMDLPNDFSMGVRIATGENNSPVTTNQTIGLANQGQGGNFSKYAIWLDRAFLRYDIGTENRGASLWIGRFDNPFFSTPLIYDDDLGFDGVAVQAKYEVLDGVVPFFNAGAFPVFNTDLNFSSNQPTKFESYDKYLFGGQLGVDWKISKDWHAKVAAAYYYFYNVEGKLSTPYTPQNASDAGDTDNSRPSFAQKGNTYMALRNIIPDASNDFGAINQYQYYGLATKFEDLALTGRIDYNGFEPFQVSLVGEFIDNVAFNKDDINAVAVNNRGAFDDSVSDSIGMFDGSSLAWLTELRFGSPSLSKAWDWNVNLGYRWIGSDAVVDGFNDSDFGLGGTNMKGFTVGGALSLSPNVWVALRWMGSDSIAGPELKTDIIQLDLNAKF